MLFNDAKLVDLSGEVFSADDNKLQVQSLDPRDGRRLTDLGNLYLRLRQLDKARSCFEQAIAAKPRDLQPRLALAVFEERNNRLPEARQATLACLEIDPKDETARCLAAVVDLRENKLAEAEQALRNLLASGPRQRQIQCAARFYLAEVLDRTVRPDEAMRTLAEAKQIAHGQGNVAALLQDYERRAAHSLRITQGLPRDVLRVWAGAFPAQERLPIPALAFLGGHPRSGTTLLEQVLGAHPGVAAFDESPAFNDVVCKLYNEAVAAGKSGRASVSNKQLNHIRDRYVAAMRQESGGNLEGKLIIDKNPSPTANLRLWLKVFPEARVLIALRDPRDVVLSCYFQNIPLNAFNANFLSLERTARHYSHLMDIWLAVRQWDGLAALETRYEDIVAGLEREGRRVTEFLGLPWDDAQARFYEKSRQKAMYSPTYHAAAQPVHGRSVGRWHAYEKHLAPILPALERYCRAFGYV